MNDILSGFAAKILPRLAGIAAAWLVGEAQRRFSLTLDPAEVTALMLAAYAGVHRLISKYTNPGDATKSVLIETQKAVVRDAPSVPVVTWAVGGTDKGVL